MAAWRGSGPPEAAFGSSGAGSAGLWWVGWCAEVRCECAESSSDADEGEFLRVAGSFPGEALAGDQAAGES